MHEPEMPTDKVNALNQRCYNARADYWDRMPFADFLPQEILRKYNPVSGYQALDIGSGTGMLASWLAAKEFDITCIDPSEEMVRRCRAKNLRTLQTTLQEYHPEHPFGLITAILSLIHLPKNTFPQELDRIASWLNPGGTFVLAMIEGKGEGVGEKNSPYPRYFAYYTHEEVLQYANKNFDCVYSTRSNGPINYLIYIFHKKAGLH